MENDEIQKRQETINDVRKMLDFLEANPEIKLPNRLAQPQIWFFGDKDGFLRSVRAFGACEKKVDGHEIHVTKTFGSVKLVAEVNRDAVCIKKTVMKTVPVEEWDCQPLLSPAEIQQIGQESATVGI
jgi:hypothetical protein